MDPGDAPLALAHRWRCTEEEAAAQIPAVMAELRTVTSPKERHAFITDRFGRHGHEIVELLAS